MSFGYSASKYSRFTHNDGKTRIELRTPKEIQNMHGLSRPRWLSILAVLTLLSVVVPAQKSKTQEQDEDFARSVKEWTTRPEFISPLVDHLPKSANVPSPKDALGHHIGAPGKLTYYTDVIG